MLFSSCSLLWMRIFFLLMGTYCINCCLTFQSQPTIITFGSFCLCSQHTTLYSHPVKFWTLKSKIQFAVKICCRYNDFLSEYMHANITFICLWASTFIFDIQSMLFLKWKVPLLKRKRGKIALFSIFEHARTWYLQPVYFFETEKRSLSVHKFLTMHMC